MKHLKLSFLPLGVILVLNGCNIGKLEAPVPISPTDNETLDGNVLFIWESVEEALLYEIEVADNKRFKELIYYKALKDTFCVVSADSFEYDQVYYWRVAAWNEDGLSKWSDPQGFAYEHLPVDLDTTYFPFGLGYEWGYERHNFGWDADGGEWSSKYTFTISVIDCFWKDDTLVFDLEGGAFRDLGSPVKFFENKVYVFGGYYPGDTITLEPEEQGDEWKEGLFVSYYDDVLYIQSAYDPSGVDITWYTQGVNRKKGIGVVSQGLSEDEIHPDYHDYTYDRLLYFYNGRDTVYKAD